MNRKIITVRFENHVQHTNTLCGWGAKLLFLCVCVTPYRNHFALETGRPYFVLRCVNSFARCAGLDIVAVGLEASA